MRYVALLRGIGPINPNMKNEHLRRVAEGEGLTGVSTVVSSGNVVFDSRQRPPALESRLEAAWPRELGFTSTTIVRSQDDIEALFALKPFGDREHGRRSSLLVTFAKHPFDSDEMHALRSGDPAEYVVATTDREIFTVTDTTRVKTPDVMSQLNKALGKQITSRTWLTVERILRKMGAG